MCVDVRVALCVGMPLFGGMQRPGPYSLPFLSDPRRLRRTCFILQIGRDGSKLMTKLQGGFGFRSRRGTVGIVVPSFRD